MTLYVYGIVDSPSFEAALSGHDGADVFSIASGDLAAAASELSHDIAPAPLNVWRHEQVLEALMQQHAVLPLRFGTLVADRDTLCDELRRMHPALTRDLGRVRGKVEFALRVSNIGNIDADGPLALDCRPKGDDAQPLRPGTGYLRARAELLRERTIREDAARRVERMLRLHLDPSADEAVWRIDAAARSATLIASCLVGRDHISRFVGAIDDVRDRHPRLKVTCTGPWAPYSFVTVRPAETWR